MNLQSVSKRSRARLNAVRSDRSAISLSAAAVLILISSTVTSRLVIAAGATAEVSQPQAQAFENVTFIPRSLLLNRTRSQIAAAFGTPIGPSAHAGGPWLCYRRGVLIMQVRYAGNGRSDRAVLLDEAARSERASAPQLVALAH